MTASTEELPGGRGRRSGSPEGGSPDDRRARGARKGGPDEGPAEPPRRARAGVGSRPARFAPGAGRHACPRARADPLRPDARLAVHVLPRRGGVMAHDLAADAALGPERPALRRRPPLELRRLRLARARARLRPERLRRDARRARSSGTSSASPRASRSPAATAASPTHSAAMRCSPSCRATARRCASSRR